jgi:hypothetical protein
MSRLQALHEAKVDGKDPARADANPVKAAHAGGQRN